MQTIRMAAIAVFLLLWMQAAQAQVLFDLNPAAQSGAPGATITFNATLTNAGLDTVFLNGANASGLAPGLTLDPTPFFDNFPFFLVGGDAATADLFTVSIDNGVPAGDYFGSFTILGGADPNAQDVLATQNFNVAVATPEPGALPMLGAGLVAAGLLFRFRKR